MADNRHLLEMVEQMKWFTLAGNPVFLLGFPSFWGSFWGSMKDVVMCWKSDTWAQHTLRAITSALFVFSESLDTTRTYKSLPTQVRSPDGIAQSSEQEGRASRWGL